MKHILISGFAAVLALCACSEPPEPNPLPKAGLSPQASLMVLERDYWVLEVQYALVSSVDRVDVRYSIAPILSQAGCISQRWVELDNIRLDGGTEVEGACRVLDLTQPVAAPVIAVSSHE